MSKEPLIYEAMAKIMADATHIGKDQTNQAQKFKYRGIDDVYNSLHGVFAKHEVFVTPEVLDKSREERTSKNGSILAFTTLRMKYTFHAKDGSNVYCIVEGEGMDSGDKSSNKAMAVAHKYALLQTFMIPTNEQKDPDAEVYETVKPYPDGSLPLNLSPDKAKEKYKDTIECIQKAIAEKDYSTGAEAWFELTDAEKAIIWTAKTKGGSFDQSEKAIIKSNEWRESHFNQEDAA